MIEAVKCAADKNGSGELIDRSSVLWRPNGNHYRIGKGKLIKRDKMSTCRTKGSNPGPLGPKAEYLPPDHDATLTVSVPFQSQDKLSRVQYASIGWSSDDNDVIVFDVAVVVDDAEEEEEAEDDNAVVGDDDDDGGVIVVDVAVVVVVVYDDDDDDNDVVFDVAGVVEDDAAVVVDIFVVVVVVAVNVVFGYDITVAAPVVCVISVC
ncbi:hypothetical protein ElyMa_005037500 [Elysia marginata]|uniref:Uncharacterized protein n=1 Tax=Elysia marginata TaxID=1093978 RepID=A0AAV4JAF6_9GAST|nr:hypothetical protein ElyMa_005037500 [Elysia marginata]